MVTETAFSCWSYSALEKVTGTVDLLQKVTGYLFSAGQSDNRIALNQWFSWLQNDLGNTVKDSQANQLAFSDVNYDQFAMLTIFLIMILASLWFITLFNLYKSKGKVKKSAFIIDDVSHKLDQQSRFLRTQEQLLTRLRSQNDSLRHQQSTLFAVINHELKNPLTAIKTNFVAWFRLASYDEVTLDRARMVENSIARLEAFCEQAAAMHELDEADTKQSTTSLSQLLCRIGDQYAEELLVQGVTIKVNAHHDYKVRGTSTILSGLLTNLLNYSVKRASCGDKITLELVERDNNLVLQLVESGFVSETGSTTFIESAEQIEIEHGPELFFASKIAQNLNVIITTRSEAGVGTTTSLSFPHYEVFTPEQHLLEDTASVVYFDHQQHPVLELCGPATSSPRCLILDDDPEVQSCLGRILSKHFNVKGVFDEDTALTETKQWQPNVIVTELRLRDGDTFSTIKKMKQGCEINDIPIIVLTTQNNVENRLKALEIDVFVFFPKPFSEELLCKTALRMCSNTAAQQELENIKENVPFQQSRDTIFLNQLNALIERNLDNVDFHFEDYFEQFSLSKRQFFRRVNALTRCTPKQYLINKRLELAKHLLSRGVLLEKVTKSCGFRNAKTLTKLYQAHYGEEII